ncbi:MAG: hypothetical protein EAZ57_10750 [Cytophagales bacterium]|nr:MAG: hypothetical protein EAZ57_10750 [Cytophagales bacterium]
MGIIPLLAQNQPKPPKVKKQKIQKIKIPFYFDGIRVGTDVSKLIFMGFNGDKSRFDLSTDISFSNRVHLNLTLGRSAMRSVIRRNSDSVVYSAQYINTGNFARLGVEYNLLRRVMNENGVYAGLHVGYASYRHSLDHAIRNSFWSGRNDVIISSFKEDGMSCVWGELSGALKGRIWRNFFAGYTIRLQYLLQVEDGKLVKSTDLPGFGSTQNNFNLLMSYQVWYRLPLGKNY